jgi:hypothetical protein
MQKIVSQVDSLTLDEPESLLGLLLALAGLRGLEETVEQEIRRTPGLIDILENKVLGREFKRGETTVLRLLIEKRFGSVPTWAEERLGSASNAQLEEWALRALNAASLQELLS